MALLLRGVWVWGLIGLTALTLAVWPARLQAQALSEADTASCPPATVMPTAGALAAARTQARDRGFLWRVSKDGRASYLFGTIHLGRLDWAFQGPQFEAAWRATDTLALELDLTDAATLEALAQGSRNGEAASEGAELASRGTGSQPAAPVASRTTARPRLEPTAEEQTRLDQLRRRLCLPAAALSSLHPVMQALTLVSQAPRWDGLDPAYAQELILGGRARATARPVIALETVALQLEALVPSEEGAARRALGDLLGQLESGRVRPVLRRLAQAWEAGDQSTLEGYADWCDCVSTPAERADLERLNDARNPALADGIAAQHARGRQVFAAVGALHMSGPRAVPRLLAERGFTVERIAFKP